MISGWSGWSAFVVATLLSHSVMADQKVFSSLSTVDAPIRSFAQEPYLAVSNETLLMSWLAIEEDTTSVGFAKLDTSGWSEPVEVTSGGDLFVNWADFPAVAPFGGQGVAIHWLRESGSGGFDYNVEVSISQDLGATWSSPLIPHSDRSASQHGFVTMNGAPDGALDVLWLDARSYGKVGLSNQPDAMQLRATRISSSGTLDKDQAVDLQTCSCCQTSSARLGDGSLAVAYRDRTDEEVRDISVVRLHEGKWSDATTVHRDGWEIAGCPVNGPAIAAQDDRLAVAWFTGANDVAAVKLAFSDDGAESFQPPVRIDRGAPLGRVDTLFLQDGSVLVTWLEWDGADEVLLVCRAFAEEGCIATEVLERNASPGSMNFPRMARIGSEIYFVWTHPVDAVRSKLRLIRGMVSPLD